MALEKNLKAVEEELSAVKDRYKQLEEKIYQTSGLRMGNLKITPAISSQQQFHLDFSKTLQTPDKTLATIGDASESAQQPLSSFKHLPLGGNTSPEFKMVSEPDPKEQYNQLVCKLQASLIAKVQSKDHEIMLHRKNIDVL